MATPFPNLQSVQLGLRLGDTAAPAPADLMQALVGVNVTQTDEAPSRFTLTFHTEVAGTGTLDYGVLQSPLLAPATRVAVSVAANGDSQVLIDGFITRQQFVPSDRPGGATFSVLGEDVSVKMDMIQLPIEYPAMGDALIAEVVLAKYALLYGVVPAVMPTPIDVVPFGYVPQQNCTDREYLKQLAQQNGNVFYIQPGPTPGASLAYWGPPIYFGTPQPPLNVNQGPFTNVESIQLSYDTLAPFFVYGYVMETEVDPYLPIPILTVGSTRFPPLAAQPALDPAELFSLSIKKNLWQDQGMDPIKSEVTAQGMTDLSTDNVVTAQGELDVERYGGVLTAPGLVGVRGTGASWDGLYYVKQVEHKISAKAGDWTYKQSFTLTREGLGSTVEAL